MVNRSLVRSLDDDTLENELAGMFGDSAEELLLDSFDDLVDVKLFVGVFEGI